MKSHKGLEEVLRGLSRRIKGIEESAGRTVFRADKLLLELTKERLEALLDAYQRGKPSLDGPGAISRFFKSMGFIPTMYTSTTEFSSTSFDEQKTMVERMGFPADKLCDKVVGELAFRDSDALPKPDVVYADSHGCDNDHRYYAQSYADLFNIPKFFVDIPLHEDDKPTLDSLNYVADQMREFVEWAEKTIPGVKYDEAKHNEILESDAIGLKYLRDIYQLAKHVPCPIPPSDGLSRFFVQSLPSRYPNMQKAIEYLRVFRDELGERVASGQGPYPEERLRLLWVGQTHFLQTPDPCKLLLERKVALPLSMQGDTIKWIGLRGVPYGEVSEEYGVKLSPLQEEADLLSTSCWGGPGKRWVKGTLQVARDIGAQGIIHYNLIGCTPMNTMGTVVAEKAEKELGIPTLNVVGRYLDKDYMTQENFDEILSAFIDKCFDWAGKPRQ